MDIEVSSDKCRVSVLDKGGGQGFPEGQGRIWNKV